MDQPEATNQLELRPSVIRFTQDSIRDRFSNRKPVEETFRKLLFGGLRISQLERIEVVHDEGHWWVIEGNRRLFIFKKLEELGRLSKVKVVVRDLSDPKVRKIYNDRKTTNTNGESIVCRRGKLEDHIRDIIKEFYDQDEFSCLIEECCVESPDADDYINPYNGPDFLPDSSRRKYKKVS